MGCKTRVILKSCKKLKLDKLGTVNPGNRKGYVRGGNGHREYTYMWVRIPPYNQTLIRKFKNEAFTNCFKKRRNWFVSRN